MITKEDLNEKMLTSYLYNLNAIGKDETWGEVAMNMKPLESWEKYQGFNLFRNASFIAQVNQKMKGYNNLTADMVLEKAQMDYEDLTADINKLKSQINWLNQLYEENQKLQYKINNFENEYKKISEIKEYVNSTLPKVEKVLAQGIVDIKPLEEKINMMWNQYQKNTNNQLQLIEFERRLALLESKMEGNYGTDC